VTKKRQFSTKIFALEIGRSNANEC